MLKRLAATSLASALCLFTLAAAPARAQGGKRAPAAPELAPAPDLAPAVNTQDGSDDGRGVGWGMPDETCYELDRATFADLFVKAPYSQEAVITSRPEPGFTDEARRNGTRGTVRLGLALSKNGKVTAAWVFNGLPDGLTEKAVAAACRIEFRPAQRNGQPVTSRVTLDYDFNNNADKDAQPVARKETNTTGGMLVERGGGGPGSNSPPDYDRPFRVNEVTRRAEIISKPEPGFTEKARKNDVTGLVRLRAVLTKEGAVTNISVVKGLPDGLTERAVAAARRIKFRPAQRDGRDVSQWIVLEYNFNIYYDDDEVERRAVILEQPAAEYTEEARRQKVEGKVVLEVVLYTGGWAAPHRVLAGLPHGLTGQAEAAVRQIKFTPAENKGRQVNVMRRVEYVFSLDPKR